MPTEQSFDLKGNKVAISVPCYKGDVPVDWCVAFAQTQSILHAHGVRSYLQVRMNSGLIHAIRNELVHTALRDPDTTHVLFVDDDIIWKPEDVLRMLAWGQKRPFVCGAYPARMDEPTFFVDLVPSPENKLVQDDDGLLKAKGVPGGFMLLRRDVFENPAMRAQSPASKPTRGDLKDELVYGFFDYIHEGLTGTGEDIAFCRRWTRAGGEIWIDPTIRLEHVGRKSYSHDFIQFLRDKQAKPPAAST